MLKITIGPAIIEVPGSLLIYMLWLVHQQPTISITTA